MRAEAADQRGAPSNDVIATVVSTPATRTAAVASLLKEGCVSFVGAWRIEPLARADFSLADTAVARSDAGMLSNAVRPKKHR